MQIGGRWPFGATPPRGLPDDFVAEIARVEASAAPEQRWGSWTLTWLEGRPVAEHDGGLRVGGAAAAGQIDGDGLDEDEDDLFPES